MSGYMKVLAEYSDKAGHKDRTGHIKRITGIITAIIMLITTAVICTCFLLCRGSIRTRHRYTFCDTYGGGDRTGNI